MKYCPLCMAEHREGVEKCATCGAALVSSLHAEEVRANPPRLLWIGGSTAEFDAVVSALHEAGIPALVAEAHLQILQRFFGTRSHVSVLANDFQRGIEIASKAILSYSNDIANIQKCFRCGLETSAALTACPKCGATLTAESMSGRESFAEEEDLPRAGKYCPLCNAKYPESYQNCTVCGVELVPEEKRGRPLRDEELKEKIVVVWRGGDPVAVSNVVSVLREAGICHHVESTHDYFVFGLAMPRPKYTVRVLQSDVDRAKDLLADIIESPFFGAQISSDFPQEVAPQTRQVSGRWNPAAANAEIWTGDDVAFGRLVEDCLRENQIGFRREGLAPGLLHLFVTTADESHAREIVRELHEATPPS